MYKLTKAEALVQTAQWQQSLDIAHTIAKKVLGEAGDMGTAEVNSELSNAVKILESCVNHFSMELGEKECELDSQ